MGTSATQIDVRHFRRRLGILKAIPQLLMVVFFLYNLFYFFFPDGDIALVGYFMGISLMSWLFLYLTSFVFRFPAYYRVPLYYVLFVHLLTWSLFLSDAVFWTLFWVSSAMAAVTMALLYRRRNAISYEGDSVAIQRRRMGNKLMLIYLKYSPMLVSLLYVLNTLFDTLAHGVCDGVLEPEVGGSLWEFFFMGSFNMVYSHILGFVSFFSVIVLVYVYVCSRIMQFCWYHRIFIWFLIFSDMLNFFDYFWGDYFGQWLGREAMAWCYMLLPVVPAVALTVHLRKK